MIDWTILRKKFGLNKASEKFEKLALYYVQDVYPNYNWEPTPLKGDGNRDIQIKSSENNEYDVWAEAKYRNSQDKDVNSQRSLERKDIDSTILSGLIYGRVRLIIFISNAKLPNTVMNRAILGARIRGIEVTAALAEQLESWLIEHPNVYEIIFDEKLMISKERTNNPVIAFKNAMFYDPISTDFLPLNKKKEFFTGELSILNLIVYSSIEIHNATITTEELPITFVNYDRYETADGFNIKKGLSSIMFLVRMNKKFSGKINICILINKAPFYHVTNFISIRNCQKFPLAYSQQLEITNAIENTIEYSKPYENGLIITLYSESSMGKSFVLRDIYQKYNIQRDMTIIGFDSNKNNLGNYSLLCKSVLFLNYGNIFWDWNISNKDDLASFKSNILNFNTNELFDCEMLSMFIDGCFDANIASDIIKSIVRKSRKKNISIISGRKLKSSRILLIDDFQYLDSYQADFMKLLLNQIKSNFNSNIIIISSTRGKYNTSSLEKFFLRLTPNHFELQGLTQIDKVLTLNEIFGLREKEHSVIADRILPDSPLLAGEVLRVIVNRMKTIRNSLDIIVAFNKGLDGINIFRDKFSEFVNQFYLLDIIYRFKKGLPIKLLKNYVFWDAKKTKKDINLLLANNLISINDNIVFPYHDYYVNAYKQLRKSDFDNANTGNFLEYLLCNKLNENLIDENHVLSMIIKCGKQYARFYKKRVQELILKYIHATKFGAALQFCEYYYEQIKKRKKLTHDEAYYLYLYADCLVHCGKQNQSYSMFTEIYNNAPSDSLEKYEAGASILNQLFWIMETDKLISDSYSIQFGIENISRNNLSNVDTFRLLKAYDSCFNRRMVAYLLKDEQRCAHEIYIDRLKSLVDKNNINHFCSDAATLIMDYARGIAVFDVIESYRLMQIALRFFRSNSNKHFRRMILCNIDTAVLNCIINRSFDTVCFKTNMEMLIKNNFYSEYFKAVLKKSACTLICFSNQFKNDSCFFETSQILYDVESEIKSALLETELTLSKRDMLLLYYIEAFLAICRKDYSFASNRMNSCLCIVSNIGRSYQTPIIHNLESISQISHIDWFTFENKELPSSVYLVDARFW